MAIPLDACLSVTAAAAAPSQGPDAGKVPRNLRVNLLKHTSGDELGQWLVVMHAAAAST